MSESIFEKTCNGPCGRTLPITEFSKRYSGYSRDGYRHQCKECVSERTKTREELNRKLFIETHGEIIEKQCRTCLAVKPVASFDRDSGTPDGHSTRCKDCGKPTSRAYYQKNAETIKAKSKAWNKANPERALQKSQEWAVNNRERSRELKREWKQRNPDHEKTPEVLQRRTEERRRQRLEAIAIMGGQCECCGLSAPVDFICFDHVGGWGKTHRSELKGKRLLVWLRDHNYPNGDGTICETCSEIHQGVRLLCFDCNMSVSFSPDGTCAHKESPEETRRKRIEAGTTERTRYEREWRIKLREEVFREYGSECYCCHQNDERFLCIDHPGNWGRAHRLETASGGPTLSWIKKHHFPKGNETCPECGTKHKAVRLACFNCNMAAGKSEDGQCPHIHEAALAA